MTFQNNHAEGGIRHWSFLLLALLTPPALLRAQPQQAPPFGYIDTPVNEQNNLPAQVGAIGVTGWALSYNTVATVKIYRDPLPGEGTSPVYIGDATLVPGSRPDLAAAIPGYPNNNWGWGMQILTNQLPGTNGQSIGNGTYTLHAIACDPFGSCTTLPSGTPLPPTNPPTYPPPPLPTYVVISVDNSIRPCRSAPLTHRHRVEERRGRAT